MLICVEEFANWGNDMDMAKAKEITKDTLVPLSAVAAMFTSIVGYGELKANVEHSKADILRHDVAIVEVAKVQRRMEMRLYGMQIKMGLKAKPVPHSEILEDSE